MKMKIQRYRYIVKKHENGEHYPFIVKDNVYGGVLIYDEVRVLLDTIKEQTTIWKDADGYNSADLAVECMNEICKIIGDKCDEKKEMPCCCICGVNSGKIFEVVYGKFEGDVCGECLAADRHKIKESEIKKKKRIIEEVRNDNINTHHERN